MIFGGRSGGSVVAAHASPARSPPQDRSTARLSSASSAPASFPGHDRNTRDLRRLQPSGR